MMIQPFSSEIAAQLWNDKFTFFWYNEQEVFHWTQEDFNQQAKLFHHNGITIVMTFSLFHERANYLPWRKEILDAIQKICIACHAYGIRVMEHHSCSLIYAPKSAEDRENLAADFKLHKSSYEHFNDSMETALENGLTLKGVNLTECLQRDGRTGQPATTGYFGHAFCFNNPDYRKVYLSYVNDLKETGIDCLLADDIQYFGSGNACACTYCRKLFHEQTGYELPDPEHWDDFYDHYENPSFIAWLRFRLNSTTSWQDTLTNHYRTIGLDTYRANYRSEQTERDFTANTFTVSRNNWAQVFQENCFSEIIKFSWPRFHCESLLQYAVAHQKNSASMSLFYPTRHDQYYLAWALSMSWGQLPFLCPEGENLTEEDSLFNQFERQHAYLFRQPEKQADLAFLLSRNTFDLTPWKNTMATTSQPLHGIVNGAYFANLCCDAILEDMPQEYFNRQKCIVAVGLTWIANELAEKLLSYVKQDGRLLIMGEFATCKSVPASAEILASPQTYRLDMTLDPSRVQPNIWQMRMFSPQPPVPAPDDRFDELREMYGDVLKRHLPEKSLIESVPHGYLAQPYHLKRKTGSMVVHILNIQGLLDSPNGKASHDDPLPNFQHGAAKNPKPLTIRLNRDDILKSCLHTPEREDDVPVDVIAEHGITTLLVPPNAFAGYAVIELQQKTPLA